MSDSSGEQSVHTNRLSKESSPYLLQHQHNPVDWFSWGPEAFDAARRQDKPIFLSVGYSTCYWCHVMERQSFENPAIADEMNRRFINIKVDREERPDVDQLYMTAVQVLTHHGGWPMSVFLTPDLRPFYGGTYFPPTDQHGRPGFVTLLRGIEDAYRNRKSDVNRTAEQLVSILDQLAVPPAPESPIAIDRAFVERLIERSTSDYDPSHGGFGGAPKFPRETLLELLLVYLATPGVIRQEDADRKTRIGQMLRHTLDALAAGGIRDQLGGGFHRYSTDAQWLVPHFEIMLYDNAMLAWVYVESFRQSAQESDAVVARGIFDFILREMTAPQGAFYTAFDAEVDAAEGQSYLWTPGQIQEVLGPDDAVTFNRAYGVDRGPNFADPHQGSGQPDQNILYVADKRAANGEPLRLMRQKLYEARRLRRQPLLDTKIITSWNALMIRALAHGGKVLNEPRYIEAASRAAGFLLHHHRQQEGGLYRTSTTGDDQTIRPRHPGFLDDYAFLAQSLIELSAATGDGAWKDTAAELTTEMLRRFGDHRTGALFFTERGADDVIIRQAAATDTPLPSGNAAAVLTLLALGNFDRAREVIAAFAQPLSVQGEGMSSLVQAAILYLASAEPFTVAVSDAASAPDRPLSPQALAQSVVSVKTEWLSKIELAVTLNILNGFHINAPTAPDQEPMIPTTLRAVGRDDVTIEYPPAQEQRFAFSDAPIQAYGGEVRFVVRCASPPPGALDLVLSYQPCNDRACLPPVSKQFRVKEA